MSRQPLQRQRSRNRYAWLSGGIGRFLLACCLLQITACLDANEPKHKVIWQPVRDHGLVATYLRPKGEEKRPAILIIGGSEGGIQSAEQLAYRFAERGWAALAVAYFGVDGLPDSLANIPLEYFDSAIHWLQQQPQVVPGDLAIVGSSRGAELALLLASHNPAITRVVAFSPSAVLWGPVGKYSDQTRAAWTLAGKALPYVPQAKAPDYSVTPYRGTPDFLNDLGQTDAVSAATIPVENIRGAVLLLSGDDDQVWPASAMSEMIMKRLSASAHRYRYEHIAYAGAGHLIGPGTDPAMTQAKHPSGVVMAFGGNEAANRHAQNAAWQKVMAFLKADIRSVTQAE